MEYYATDVKNFLFGGIIVNRIANARRLKYNSDESDPHYRSHEQVFFFVVKENIFEGGDLLAVRKPCTHPCRRPTSSSVPFNLVQPSNNSEAGSGARFPPV